MIGMLMIKRMGGDWMINDLRGGGGGGRRLLQASCIGGWISGCLLGIYLFVISTCGIWYYYFDPHSKIALLVIGLEMRE
jgi:hypothetical protein